MEKGIPGNESEKQACVTILISDEIDFKPKLIHKDRE